MNQIRQSAARAAQRQAVARHLLHQPVDRLARTLRAGRDGSVTGALGISMAASGSSMSVAVKRCVPALKAAAAELRELI